MLLVATASASTIALLALDGRGVDAEAAEAATEALRDALSAAGRVEVPTGSALGAALTVGHEAELARARELSAQGRAALARGDSTGAASALDEAARLHLASGSGWARRNELGDVAWALADAHLRQGDTVAARDDLGALARFWPGYTRTRTSSTGAAARLFTEVEAALAKEPWSPPTDGQSEVLRSTLGADWLVVGVLDGTGTIELRVVGDEGDDAVSGRVAVPVDALADDWGELAERVLAITGAAPVAARTPDEEGDVEPEVRVTVAPVAPPVRPERADDRVRIRQTGTIRYEDGPITNRWWFWVALAGVVGAGTTAGIVAAQPAPTLTVHETPSWTLTVVPP